MSKNGNADAQSHDEMIAALRSAKEVQLSKRRGQASYRRDNDEHSKAEIQRTLDTKITDFATYGEKERIALENLDRVAQKGVSYLYACRDTASLPTNIGLARALGYSDRALRYWRQKHPESPTAKWLESFAELCSEVLSQSSLSGHVNPICGIFVLKSCYGWKETSEVVISPGAVGIEENQYNAEEIRARYLLPDEND